MSIPILNANLLLAKSKGKAERIDSIRFELLFQTKCTFFRIELIDLIDQLVLHSHSWTQP